MERSQNTWPARAAAPAPASAAPAQPPPAHPTPAPAAPVMAMPATAAGRIVRGVVRLLTSMDQRPLLEFQLPDGRRADVLAVDAQGAFTLVEVKSSVADFRADAKWRAYLGYCDAFFFAVDEAFPQRMLPADAGIIVADAYQGAVVRGATPLALHAARRRALLLRFARTAAGRLAVLSDAPAAAGGPGR